MKALISPAEYFLDQAPYVPEEALEEAGLVG